MNVLGYALHSVCPNFPFSFPRRSVWTALEADRNEMVKVRQIVVSQTASGSSGGVGFFLLYFRYRDGMVNETGGRFLVWQYHQTIIS